MAVGDKKIEAILKASCDLSDTLHKAEATGVELPKYVDRAWEVFTVAMQSLTCNDCIQYQRGVCSGKAQICEEYRYA